MRIRKADMAPLLTRTTLDVSNPESTSNGYLRFLIPWLTQPKREGVLEGAASIVSVMRVQCTGMESAPVELRSSSAIKCSYETL